MSARPLTSRKLPRGGSALDPETVRRLQRERLQEGLVRVVALQGYPATRVADITAAAQVSRNTFYALFADREACFAATWEAILARETATSARPSSAGRDEPRTVHEHLHAVLGGLTTAVIARPDHARVLLNEALAVGSDGWSYRRRVVRQVEQCIGTAAGRADGPTTISPSSRTVIASGVLQVIDQRLRSGRVRQLRSVVDDLAAWAASYETSSPLPAHRRLDAPAPPVPPSTPLPLPRGHLRLPRSFVGRYQRARILQTIVELTGRGDYATVSVPEIVAAAHISNKTFYDQFPDKHTAFMAAYDEVFASLFAATWSAAAGGQTWVEAISDGITAWVDHLAADPHRARFGFIDVLAGGRDAAAKVDESHQAFAHLLSHGYDNLSPGRTVPPIAAYAIVAGIAGLIREWIVAGRTHELHKLAPDLCYAALAPFLGDADARSMAQRLKAA
jgi:AcrR family transcriptional regulator